MTLDVDLADGAFWGGDPHEALTWMRRHQPMYWDGSVWGVTRYHDVKEVSRHPELFSSAQGSRVDGMALPMMVDMDDPEHWQRRKLVNRGFTPRRVRDSEPAVRRACDEIIDAVVDRGGCDLVTDVAAWLPMIMIGDALGVPPAERKLLLQWSEDMLSTQSGPQGVERASAAYQGFREFALGAIAARRAEPSDDLMSVLVDADVDGDRLDDESIIHESLLILIGGDETTRHVITGGMYQLLRNPAERQKLVDDPAKIPTAVEEMLRWVTPIKHMARRATVDAEVGGQPVKAGDTLMLLYPSANRDEDVFDDPFRFDVERQPNDHVAFGFGAHYCLGNSLARLELTCMVEHLLRRLPGMELVDDAEPAHRPANFVSGYEHLPVRF